MAERKKYCSDIE